MRARVGIGDLIDGKYRVESRLGEGGMGVVFAVRNEVIGGRYAIKILSDADDPVLRERFFREARAAASLNSEHVTRVFTVGVLLGGEPFIVMELLEGTDLDELVAGQGPRPVAEAVSYLLQACDALAEAHAKGMVHRDIKPANVFLATRSDGTSVIKVLDFGISKAGFARGAAAPALTATGSILGSPLFMAPEQLASSRDVDARADIWSLGATLFELLSAEVPFDGPTIAEVFAKVVREPPRPLLDIRPALPAELWAVIRRCLEKDPEDRYADIGELAAALAPFAPDGVDSARRITLRLVPIAKTMVGEAPATAVLPAPLAPTVTEPAPVARPLVLPPQARRSSRAWVVAAVVVAALIVGTVIMVGTATLAGSIDQSADPTERPPKKPGKPGRKRSRAPAAMPMSQVGADARLSDMQRAGIEAELATAQDRLDARDYHAVVAPADRALGRIRDAGILETESSLFASRAALLKGLAFQGLAEREWNQTFDSNYMSPALQAFGKATTWDPGGETCAIAHLMRFDLVIYRAYVKYGAAESGRSLASSAAETCRAEIQRGAYRDECKHQLAGVQAELRALADGK